MQTKSQQIHKMDVVSGETDLDSFPRQSDQYSRNLHRSDSLVGCTLGYCT